MDDQINLSYMASMYMALADQTRLRLLSLMRDQEVCVNDLTETLGDSQPKISRHLAYLRNAGIVDTRRDGKWIHYSIRWPDEHGGRVMLQAALEWLSGEPGPGRFAATQEIASIETIVDSTYIYGNTNIHNRDEKDDPDRSAHNELEEFLL